MMFKHQGGSSRIGLLKNWIVEAPNKIYRDSQPGQIRIPSPVDPSGPDSDDQDFRCPAGGSTSSTQPEVTLNSGADFGMFFRRPLSVELQ